LNVLDIFLVKIGLLSHSQSLFCHCFTGSKEREKTCPIISKGSVKGWGIKHDQ
jgi:hypothetical protein